MPMKEAFNVMRLSRTQGLVLLNAVMLAALAAVTVGPRGSARNDRRRAAYTVTAGSVKGTDAATVWIVDETNQDMIAIVWNAQQNQLEGLGYRDLAADGATLVRGGRSDGGRP